MKKSLNKIAAFAISSLTTLGTVHANIISEQEAGVTSSSTASYNSPTENLYNVYNFNSYSEIGILEDNIPMYHKVQSCLNSPNDRTIIFELVSKIFARRPSSIYTLKDYLCEDLADIKIVGKKQCFNYLCQVVSEFLCKYSYQNGVSKLYGSATELKNARASECLVRLYNKINDQNIHVCTEQRQNAVICFRYLIDALPLIENAHLDFSQQSQSRTKEVVSQNNDYDTNESTYEDALKKMPSIDVDFVFPTSYPQFRFDGICLMPNFDRHPIK